MLQEAYGRAQCWNLGFTIGINVFLMAVRVSASTNNDSIDRASNPVRSDRRNSVQQTSAAVGVSIGSVHCIILHRDQNMSGLCQHLVPRKHDDLLETYSLWLIKCWCSEQPNHWRWNLVLYYDPQPKRQLTEWKCKSSLKTELRGLSPRANYTDRATAACRWT
jgi:hypothetical protein